MAINTKAKRSSIANLVLPWYSTAPPPLGHIGPPSRQHVAHQYRGVRASSRAVFILLPSMDPVIQQRETGKLNIIIRNFQRRLEALEG